MPKILLGYDHGLFESWIGLFNLNYMTLENDIHTGWLAEWLVSNTAQRARHD